MERRPRRKPLRLRDLLLCALAASCAAKPPEPILVLENPATHERASFYREIPFKVPADHDEARHLAGWRAEQERKGFTVEVGPREPAWEPERPTPCPAARRDGWTARGTGRRT